MRCIYLAGVAFWCGVSTPGFGQQQAPKDSTQQPVNKRVMAEPLIKDARTAAAVAEALAFSAYGEALIKKQRPYQTTFINGYWRVAGTLKYDTGGVFEILLDARDGRVVQLSHGK
jgi:hypothetical protein